MPALMEAGLPASGPAPPGLPRPGDHTVPAAETLRSGVRATCGGPGHPSGAHPWWQGLMGFEWPWASAPKPCSASPADRTGPRGQCQGCPRPLLPGRAGAPLGLRGPTVPSSPVPTPFCGLMLCLRFPAAQFRPPPPTPKQALPWATWALTLLCHGVRLFCRAGWVWSPGRPGLGPCVGRGAGGPGAGMQGGPLADPLSGTGQLALGQGWGGSLRYHGRVPCPLTVSFLQGHVDEPGLGVAWNAAAQLQAGEGGGPGPLLPPQPPSGGGVEVGYMHVAPISA